MNEHEYNAQDAFELILEKCIDGMVEHDDPDCPQDDTCDCENVAQINSACHALEAAIRAPIPPAEEIAAMREVVEAARAALPAMKRADGICDHEGLHGCEDEMTLLGAAIIRLDAARKGGA